MCYEIRLLFSKEDHTFRRVIISHHHVVQKSHDSSSSPSCQEAEQFHVHIFSLQCGQIGQLGRVLIWPTDMPGRQGWKMEFLCCSALSQAHLYPPLWNKKISRENVLWGFFAFRRLESGAQLEVCRESCSDFLLPLFSEKLMFKNAPTPQEFKEGDDAVIVCDVVSSLPPTIIWKHKGRDVILKKDGKAQEVSWCLSIQESNVHLPSGLKSGLYKGFKRTKWWWSQGRGEAICT